MATTESRLPRPSLEERLTHLLYIDGEKLAYLIIFVLAILTRFWDLGTRVMSHDESLHTRYSWNLYRGDGFIHTPLMHGPLLFHMTALCYLLFGANDFTARIYPAVVGVVVVMLPYFMRKWLGKFGALAASFFFLISPMILYYSRYIRHDMPAILGALIMGLAIWRYIEERKLKYLLWLSGGQAVLYASKEVSFIYVAIFGSFLMLYFIGRLLDVEWKYSVLKLIFGIALIGVLLSGLGFGYVVYAQSPIDEPPSSALSGDEILQPADDLSLEAPQEEPGISLLGVAKWILVLLLVVALLMAIVAVIVGQWHNLRRFPELDAMFVMGTLILPMLSPFLIHCAGFDPVDETPEGIVRSLLFTIPMVIVSVLIGVVWFMRPPKSYPVPISSLPDPEGEGVDDPQAVVEIPPSIGDWFEGLLSSRWWAIGALFWLFFFLFFTTLFTNGGGIGTGIVGSLGYWLAQQEVKRGGQPWYYYLLVQLPIYENLPLLLSMIAGGVGLVRLIRSVFRMPQEAGEPTRGADDAVKDDAQDETGIVASSSHRSFLDLDAPISFPVLAFTSYWTVVGLVAYSVAGEKMPWLTTHLTTPMILLSGWVVGVLLSGIKWQKLWTNNAWALLFLLPVVAVALLRMGAPLCKLSQNNLLCNTIVPPRYQAKIFAGSGIPELMATSAWLVGVIAFGIALIGVIWWGRRIGLGQVARLASLCLVGWLSVHTARTAWMASFVNYDYATEYLVYAHSAGSVKEIMARIDEISLKTTDGYGLRVAYDNKVSWPFSWYLRDYYNAVYYGEQPSRGLIGDAPVVLAGPGNWTKVEPQLGDRYYKFEYIRMWWPMQDYFGYERPEKLLEAVKDFMTSGELQRAIWDIFYLRDYTAYGELVMRDYELSQWPVAERMRVYIRKDVFAQVWDYGVVPSEIAQAVDPYAEGMRQLVPDLALGSGLLNRPHDIALGPDGLLYVADSGNHRIVVFEPDGKLVRVFGNYGLAPQVGVLNEPWGLAVGPDGTVYVADTWNHRVSTYTAEGQHITSWGSEGPNQIDNPYAFWGPRDVAVDNQGVVYVADTGNKRVLAFDANGVYLRQIGSGGTQDGQLDEPVGLEIGNDGMLYVADTWNQRIQVFTQNGLPIRMWYVEAWFAQTSERPYIDVDGQANVYVTDPEAFRVLVFNSVGEYLYSFGDYTTIGLAGAVLADDGGYLFVVDTGNGVIQRYDIQLAGVSDR